MQIIFNFSFLIFNGDSPEVEGLGIRIFNF
jgi:hypothetical protein